VCCLKIPRVFPVCFTRTATSNFMSSAKMSKGSQASSSRRSRRPRRNAQRVGGFTYVPPQSKRVRLTYGGGASLTEAAAGNGVQRVYRLNGAYDVDTTVGSTSTPGFAEMATFFSNYRVWSADVRVTFAASGASAGTPVQVGFYPNATNTYLTGPLSWIVAPGCHTSVISGDGTGGKNVVTLTRHYDLPSIARVTRSQYRNDMDYSSVINTTPSRQLQLSVFGWGNSSGSAVKVTFTIWVAMDIEFFNPIQLSS